MLEALVVLTLEGIGPGGTQFFRDQAPIYGGIAECQKRAAIFAANSLAMRSQIIDHYGRGSYMRWQCDVSSKPYGLFVTATIQHARSIFADPQVYKQIATSPNWKTCEETEVQPYKRTIRLQYAKQWAYIILFKVECAYVTDGSIETYSLEDTEDFEKWMD